MSQNDNMGNCIVRIWKFIKFIMTIILIFTLAYYLAFKTDLFVLKDIEITCNNENTKVLFESFDKHFRGENIFTISMTEAKQELEKNPYVSNVKIKRKFPDKIGYDAVLREEKVAFLYNELVLFLDKDGILLKIGEEVDDLLILEGFLIKSFVVGRKLELTEGKELENTLLLVNLIEQSNFEIKPKLLYSNGNIMLVLNKEFKVNFGKGHGVEGNYNEFIDIYKDLKSKGINSGVIDVANKGYPVYKPFGE